MSRQCLKLQQEYMQYIKSNEKLIIRLGILDKFQPGPKEELSSQDKLALATSTRMGIKHEST